MGSVHPGPPSLCLRGHRLGRREGRNLAPSSLGSEVSASLGKAGRADGWGQLQAPLPTGQGSLVTLGPQRPHPSRPTQAPVHPEIPLIPPPASSQRAGPLDAFSKFPGTAPFLLEFLAPRPIPAMGKGRHHPAQTHALSWALGGGSAPAAVRCGGAKEESPD